MDLKVLKNNNQGFSLVEILVAFLIITSTIVAIFSLIVQNIEVQTVNKDFLIASMLAQEGLELVRNSRDENWLITGDTWDEITGKSNDDFMMDYNDGNIPIDIDGIANARLYKNVSGFYDHDNTGIATKFYRILEIDDSGTPDFVTVTSQVQWTVNGAIKNYVAETLLYDWR